MVSACCESLVILEGRLISSVLTQFRIAERVCVEPPHAMMVQTLPFSQATFEKIIPAFRIHRPVSRIMRRNTSALFSVATVQDSMSHAQCFGRLMLSVNHEDRSTD